MRSLSLINIILIFSLAGCVSIKPKKLQPIETQTAIDCQLPAGIFDSAFDKALFKASLDVRDHNMTGLLFVKKMTDSVHRIIFSNEFGMTFFDFELTADSFNVVYCFEPMNKKGLIRIFETDFRLLLAKLDDPDDCTWYLQKGSGTNICKTGKEGYTIWNSLSPDCNSIVERSGYSNFIDKTILSYHFNNGTIPAGVTILNPLIKLKLRLSLISRN